MGSLQAKNRRKILAKEINASMILISNTNKRIQNFISLFDIFEEDEERIDKIRSEIKNDYKILCDSKWKIKGIYDPLPQDDAELSSLFQYYNNKSARLTQDYKSFIEKPSIGSWTLSIICNTAANRLGLHIYDLQTKNKYCHYSEIFCLGDFIVAIPNSRLFIHCWRSWKHWKGVGCIFDLVSKTEIIVPIFSNCLNSGGICYKIAIYFFGGSIKNRSCDKVRKFDLKRNLWYHIAPLPEPSRDCSCTIFKDSILIIGTDHKKLYNTVHSAICV